MGQQEKRLLGSKVGDPAVIQRAPTSRPPDLTSQPSLGALSKKVQQDREAAKPLPVTKDFSSRAQPLSKGVGRAFTRRRSLDR